jgi:hypothetical protein
MRSLKTALLAASLTAGFALSAAAQTIITPTGEMKKATMKKGMKLPADAKEIDPNMAIIVMDGKRYMVPFGSREFLETFIF